MACILRILFCIEIDIFKRLCENIVINDDERRTIFGAVEHNFLFYFFVYKVFWFLFDHNNRYTRTDRVHILSVTIICRGRMYVKRSYRPKSNRVT